MHFIQSEPVEPRRLYYVQPGLRPGEQKDFTFYIVLGLTLLALILLIAL